MKLLPLQILLITVLVSNTQTQPTFHYPENCAPPNQTAVLPLLGNITSPPLPVLPDSFQVRVEANIVNKKQTVVTEEYYDKLNNRASLKVFENNTVNYMIFDYNHDQLIYDVNGGCYATDLMYDSNQLLFGMKPPSVPGGIPHIYSTNQAFHFAKVNGLMYMGNATIRGIAADHWQSCMYWPLLASNFTLDYYFTAYKSSWLDPDLSLQVPIRAVINGSTGASNFYHIYEYFDFRSSIWGDDTVFETPKGAICKNRKQIRKVPQLAGQYSYREEIVSTNYRGITQADVYYDYTYKLMRFDYRSTPTTYPYYTANPVTEIHDYSTGIAYAIDNTLGNCSMIPIQNSTFGSSVNISTSANQNQQFYIRMTSPSQLFYLDNTTYTYEGQRTVRGILCDVFISNRSDFSLPGVPPFQSVFEFYFLNSDWQENNDIGSTSTTNTNIPIQLVISTPDSGVYQATYNIYNFDPEDPSYNRFGVTSCYDDNSKKSFIIQFPGTWDNSLLQYTNQFNTAITNLITTQAHVSHLRIQKPQFHVEPDRLLFLATLLDLPSPLAYFSQLPGRFQQFSNDLTITVTGPDDCARYCNDPSKLDPCNSFDYCGNQNLCTLSKIRSQEGGTLVSSQGLCDHYTRTAKITPSDLDLLDAWKELKNSVIVGNFIVTLSINGQPSKFIAGSIDEGVAPNGQRTMTSQTLLSQFNMQYNKDIPGYDDLILTGIAIDDCASGCISQQSWVCNAFTYCFDSGYCTLTKLHPDVRPGSVVNKPLCDLYTKKYTVNYNPLPGITVLSSSDTIYQNIFSSDDCARLCSNYNGFNCKSFDYCDEISTCYLGSAHYYDIPASNKVNSPMCTHYSRKYLYDFKMTKTMLLTNVDDRIIQNVALDQCAKLCVDQESASCASFGYCANTTTCRLSTISMKNVGQTSQQPNLYCDVYTRMSFPDGSPYIANPTKYYPKIGTSTKTTGYSGGAMVGLAFAMLVVGIVLAVGVFFGLKKFRKSDDVMAVGFVKQEVNG